MENSRNEGIFNLVVDEEAKAHLLETARWTKFLAIIGYVILGLLIFVGLLMGLGLSVMPSMSAAPLGEGTGVVFMLVYLCMAILYFFPTYYLYKYSVLIKPAILHSNQEQFNHALSFQRRMFKFIGILMLIVLAFYALAFIFGIVTAAVAGFAS